MVSSFPVQVLYGIYLGVLTGIIPGLVAWSLGFLFKYSTGVTIPGFGVVALALALAGVNGGLLALNDPTLRQNVGGVVVITAITVVLMISLYAHSRGDTMGTTFPKRVSLRGLRERTLSTDVVELVGGRGQATVTISGDVADMEGYPALSEEIRAEMKKLKLTFPADLPLSELESRVGDRLRSEFDLADVAVSLNENAEATVVAAPPLSGLSKRIPAGKRAVSVEGLVPTGIALGDEIEISAGETTVRGTLVSARSGDRSETTSGNTATGEEPEDPLPDGGETVEEPPPPRAPTTTGGDGRVTLAVSRGDAETLLGVPGGKIVVRSRGTRREYELLSVLRRTGKRFRKLTIRRGGPLDGVSLGEVSLREEYSVAVLAVRQPDGWVVAPTGAIELAGGDDVFVVGTREALDAFAGVVT